MNPFYCRWKFPIIGWFKTIFILFTVVNAIATDSWVAFHMQNIREGVPKKTDLKVFSRGRKRHEIAFKLCRIVDFLGKILFSCFTSEL